MRRLALVVSVVMVMGFSSRCSGPPESIVPLSTPPTSSAALSVRGVAPYDARLIGLWCSVKKLDSLEDRTGYLNIQAGEYPATLEILAYREGYDDAPPDWVRAIAHASKVRDQIYYNVKRHSDLGYNFGLAGEPPGYIIARTEISEGDTLHLRFMNEGLLKTLMENGEINGREVVVDAGIFTTLSHISLEVSRSQLVRLIRRTGAEKLFAWRVGPFQRVDSTEAKCGTVTEDN